MHSRTCKNPLSRLRSTCHHAVLRGVPEFLEAAVVVLEVVPDNARFKKHKVGVDSAKGFGCFPSAKKLVFVGAGARSCAYNLPGLVSIPIPMSVVEKVVMLGFDYMAPLEWAPMIWSNIRCVTWIKSGAKNHGFEPGVPPKQRDSVQATSVDCVLPLHYMRCFLTPNGSHRQLGARPTPSKMDYQLACDDYSMRVPSSNLVERIICYLIATTKINKPFIACTQETNRT